MSLPATSPFQPDDYTGFRFAAKEVAWSPDNVAVTFRYQLEATNSSARNVVELCERFVFPLANSHGLAAVDTEVVREAFDRITNHLGLVAGISYYKMAAPAAVFVDVGTWTASQMHAHAEILSNGLGEYCFVNNMDPDLRPRFHYSLRQDSTTPVHVIGEANRPLVPVGGGKDSCVTIEALRPHTSPTLITVNRYPVIAEVIADAELPDLAVKRILDPQIRSLNERGALNGHVPATAIVSLAVLSAAVLHGHDAVVMSNERSASEGNVEYRGRSINHQWSKSADAELLLRSLIESDVTGIAYFSLLRPLSELSIARSFAATCGRYLESFSSCNAAFRLDPERRVSRWCGHCPKCQFVYLALATALSKTQLESIWGAELFVTSPIEGFEALLGLTEWKPFECVGESGECRVALAMLANSPEWRNHKVVGELMNRVAARGLTPSDAERVAVFTPMASSAIPTAYQPFVPVDTVIPARLPSDVVPARLPSAVVPARLPSDGAHA